MSSASRRGRLRGDEARCCSPPLSWRVAKPWEKMQTDDLRISAPRQTAPLNSVARDSLRERNVLRTVGCDRGSWNTTRCRAGSRRRVEKAGNLRARDDTVPEVGREPVDQRREDRSAPLTDDADDFVKHETRGPTTVSIAVLLRDAVEAHDAEPPIRPRIVLFQDWSWICVNGPLYWRNDDALPHRRCE